MRISDWSSDVCSSDLTKLRRDARGTTLVEFALASPILIMFMLAVMQTGMTMHAYSALREVIGSGGRAALVASQDTSAGVMSEPQVEALAKPRAFAAGPRLRADDLTVDVRIERKSDVEGESVSVREDLGVSRIIKK